MLLPLQGIGTVFRVIQGNFESCFIKSVVCAIYFVGLAKIPTSKAKIICMSGNPNV